MADDESLLLAAIVQDPDDDTVRLVYADWLDENGRAERAEFIRSQVRISAVRRRRLFFDGRGGAADPPRLGQVLTLTYDLRQDRQRGEWLLAKRHMARGRRTFDVQMKNYGPNRTEGFLWTGMEVVESQEYLGHATLRLICTMASDETAPEVQQLTARTKELHDRLELVEGVRYTWSGYQTVASGENPPSEDWDNARVSRGFGSHLFVGVHRWLSLCDRLAWCPEEGRPCPETAHPWECVILYTGFAPVSISRLRAERQNWRTKWSDSSSVLDVFRAEWPRIRFEEVSFWAGLRRPYIYD